MWNGLRALRPVIMPTTILKCTQKDNDLILNGFIYDQELEETPESLSDSLTEVEDMEDSVKEDFVRSRG